MYKGVDGGYFFSHFDEYLVIDDQEDLNQKKMNNWNQKMSEFIHLNLAPK